MFGYVPKWLYINLSLVSILFPHSVDGCLCVCVCGCVGVWEGGGGEWIYVNSSARLSIQPVTPRQLSWNIQESTKSTLIQFVWKPAPTELQTWLGTIGIPMPSHCFLRELHWGSSCVVWGSTNTNWHISAHHVNDIIVNNKMNYRHSFWGKTQFFPCIRLYWHFGYFMCNESTWIISIPWVIQGANNSHWNGNKILSHEKHNSVSS